MGDEDKKRKAILTRMRKLLDQAKSHPTTPLDLATAKTLLETNQTFMSNCEEVQNKLLAACADDDAIQVQETAFEPVVAIFVETKSKLRTIIEDLTPTRAASSSHSSGGGSFSGITVRLPKIDVPTFDGNYADWTSFIDLFNATVDSNPHLAPAQKLQYLKGALQREPANLVKSFSITDAHYQEALNLLKVRYDNRREIITSIISNMLNQKNLTNESATELQSLLDRTSESIRSLTVLGAPVNHWDWILLVIYVNKIDPATRREWAIRQTGTTMPTFKDLTDFLANHVRGLLATGASNTSNTNKGRSGERHAPSTLKTHHTSTESSCAFCRGDHQHYKCSDFLSKTPTERSSLAKRHHLCFNCLNRDHHLKDCRSKSSCRKCGKKHHTLLHEESRHQQIPVRNAPPPSRGANTTDNPVNGNGDTTTGSFVSHHTTTTEVKTLLKTALVRVADSTGHLQLVRIFLDDGSEGTLITEDCVHRLGLRRSKSGVTIGGVGGVTAGRTRGRVEVTLCHREDIASNLPITAYIMSSVTDHLPRRQVKKDNWTHINGLDLADPQWHLPSEVDVLVGQDYYNHAIREGFRMGPPQAPAAQNTIFGWVLSGAVVVEPTPSLRIHHVTTELDQIVKRFWEVEELPKVRILTKDEKLVETHFLENYSRDEEGRFVVGVPFNKKIKDLGTSRAMAVRRWISGERKLQRNPENKQQHTAFMREYISLGHMEKVSPGEPVEEVGHTYHLPHHHVINEGSTTTKLRVVFDGSAKTSSGVSLNDAIYVGATLQDDLYDLLLRFRLHPIVIKADVTKMFRQFRLKKEDADYHRIVWRETPEEPLVDYRLLTVTYGTGYASNLATRCMQQLGKDCKDKYPLASEALLESLYVDDVMRSVKTEKEAIQLYSQLTDAVATAGLQLRKWSTNNSTVLAAIPEKERETSLHSFDTDETIKALGVQWCPSSDNFSFKCSHISDGVLTKRVLLADLSKVFDPIGFLSCVTVRAKLQMQELWRRNVDWDDEAPSDIQQQWIQYQTEMMQLQKVKIPRCITTSAPDVRYQLHGFSDSSIVAYGCCVYLRAELPDGRVFVNLVTSKTRVAPLRQISLPRLELMSACELSVLIDRVKTTLNLNCEMFCWTDSTITLKWIQSSPRRWQTFVANRVALIQQHTEVEWWRHVPGVENPADLASRGVPVTEILNSNFWFHGPSWLTQRILPAFPMNASMDGVDLEEKKTRLTCHHLQLDTTVMERFSSLIRLKRVTAHIIRLLKNAKKGTQPRSGPLGVDEINEALTIWIKKVQLQFFGDEIYNLLNKKNLPPKSKLTQLYPFLDAYGVVRVGGRLHHANVPEGRKHPIILPAESHLTNLITHHYHHINFHGGFQLTWSSIQREFWVLSGRDKVRHFVRNCVPCRRQRRQVAEQLMGSLPSPRITPSRPFLHVGVDYAGPFLLKNPIGRAPKTYKGYMCLFVCMATKAIHLEAVSALSTAAFLESLRRFVSRRGLPANIYSDCGTNFVGAERELRQHIRSPEHQTGVQNELASQGIQFNFNPPSSPHQGGLWEAGVKSAKFHLRRVLGNRVLTFEVFSTFLCQVEAILNSRPLHPASPDSDDLAALTPGHFLIGEPLTAVPDADLRDFNVNRLSFFQKQQQMLQHFWHRWSTEYLNTLQQRNKWKWEQENVKVGDLVLIKDEICSVQQWKMGRVIEVHPGEDGKVRVVTGKTATATFQRPIILYRLCDCRKLAQCDSPPVTVGIVTRNTWVPEE